MALTGTKHRHLNERQAVIYTLQHSKLVLGWKWEDKKIELMHRTGNLIMSLTMYFLHFLRCLKELSLLLESSVWEVLFLFSALELKVS
jgi:hypothetical protein